MLGFSKADHGISFISSPMMVIQMGSSTLYKGIDTMVISNSMGQNFHDFLFAYSLTKTFSLWCKRFRTEMAKAIYSLMGCIAMAISRIFCWYHATNKLEKRQTSSSADILLFLFTYPKLFCQQNNRLVCITLTLYCSKSIQRWVVVLAYITLINNFIMMGIPWSRELGFFEKEFFLLWEV